MVVSHDPHPSTEDELTTARARLEFLLTAAPTVVYSDQVLPGTPMLFVSSNVRELLGYEADEVRQPGFWDAHVHPDDVGRLHRSFTDTLAGDATVQEYRMRHADGGYRWLRDETHLVRDNSGSPAEIVGSLADVTLGKHVEEELRASEARFRLLVENLEIGFWLLDPVSQQLEYVSPGYERMVGVSLGDAQADPWAWMQAAHPDDRDWLRAEIEANPASVDVEYRYLAPDGSWRWAQARTFEVRDATGTLQNIAGILTDVTDRHRAAEELRESELRFRQLAENTGDCFWMVDTEGRLLYVNPAYERVFGQAVAELHENPRAYFDLVHPDDRDYVRAHAGDLTGADLTFRIIRPDGSVAWIHDEAFPVRDEQGRVIRLAGIATDITRFRTAADERASLLDRLDEQERDRAAVAESIARLSAGASAEATAATICDEIARLNGVAVATILFFDRHGGAIPIGSVTPVGAPVQVGHGLPDERAGYLRERTEQGMWMEAWRERPLDRAYGRRWTEVGLKELVYLPLRTGEHLLGVLVAGTIDAGAPALTNRVPALTEYAAVAGALLAPQLEERLRNGDMRARLEDIIARGAFRAVFQPVFELMGGTVVGYEALTRFDDGQRPEDVFAAAEAAGASLTLEAATMRRAIEASRDLPSGPWLSVNASPALIGETGRLTRVLEGAQRPIVLEITERVAVEDYRAVRETAHALPGEVRIAVDDAGAGFASLRHIVELRPEFVKLDMGLVRHIDTDQARQAMVAGMAYFARETGCAIIAEGIETPTERDTLRRLGVVYGQGYLLGRPAPATGASRPWTSLRWSDADQRAESSPEASIPVT